ncbi:3-dehydroquinate synthase [Fulvivirga lutea]|uniref:3-dehydroquinate synthase n=1 Tax=Fulvivirga lutea TaxID=2810512 RepID=A0A974WFY7_9BACT|nr:3-dehydroquinate synthase [Fulvivirga lutea]QSE97753.1 3-dehydroquinate synthase [Fulvivirga lutea]
MSNVIFSTQISKELNRILDSTKYSKLAVIVDENTLKHCLPLLDTKDYKLIEINAGEKYKTLDTCTFIWQKLTEYSFDRHGLVINLGGGVIGDMGGFCASTYKRGIRFINIPTTLLAQVDASVGGKLGVDFNGFKNHIGLFAEPEAVLIDAIFLRTLPENELKSGYAEVIKHHLIRDFNGWNTLSQSEFNSLDWLEIIKHSVKIKNQIVSEDPRESGLRKILNFGHTVGHAIESHFLNTDEPLLHGEAIALGMICESHISFQRNMISKDVLNEITHHISNHYKLRVIKEEAFEILWNLMGQDKKNNTSNVLAVLLNSIGEATFDCTISKKETFEALNFLNHV